MHMYFQSARTYKRPRGAESELLMFSSAQPALVQRSTGDYVLRVHAGRRPTAVARQLRLLDPVFQWTLVGVTDDVAIPLQECDK